MYRRLPLLAVTPLAALPVLAVLAACGSSPATGTGTAVAVKATDSACEIARATVPAGRTHVTVTNAGDRVTEVYVYGQQAGAFSKIVGEVENVGPGTSRGFDVTLGAGTYEVACRPGMTGAGIRTRIVAGRSGSAGASAASPSANGERTVEVAASDTQIVGVEGFSAKAGETVRFVFDNNGTGAREMGVLGPDGALIAEAEAAAGAEGEATVTFPKPGAHSFTVHPEGKDDQAIKHAFTVS